MCGFGIAALSVWNSLSSSIGSSTVLLQTLSVAPLKPFFFQQAYCSP